MPLATDTITPRAAARTPARGGQALLRWLALCLWLPLLAACGGGGGSGGGASDPPPPSASALIGPAGGTLTGPDGVQLVVPPGALSAPTTLTVTRRAEGAPALPGYLSGAGAAYEFTPHNLGFAVPVLLRLPVPAGVDGTRWLVAGPGEDWTEHTATLSGGMAELLRNRLSWYYGGWGCSHNPNDPNLDPSGCTTLSGGTVADTTPAQALQLVSHPGSPGSSAGAYRLEVPANVGFTTSYRSQAHCGNARIRVTRRQLDRSPDLLETLFDQGTAPSFQGGTPPGMYATGSVAFAPIGLTHADNGRHVYAFRFSCTRLDGRRFTYGDDLRITVAIPVPATTQTVGGSLSGLTGSLTLRNNGGDDLVLNSDGAFRFATPVGTGAPYSVTVASQPAGQTCSVQNGSGTASTDVNNVAVACATGASWQGAALLEQSDIDRATTPHLAFDPQGNAIAVWMQGDGSTDRIWARRYTPNGGWGAAQTINSNTNASGYVEAPKVALDAAGNAVAIWSQHDGSQRRVRAARYTAGAWGADGEVDTEAGEAYAPDIGIDGNGHALAVWIHEAGGLQRVRANRLVAGVWQTAVNIDGAVGNTGVPRVAVFANGGALAVWQQQLGDFVHVFHNAFNGTGWSSADRLHENISPWLGEPSLVAEGSGGAQLVWTQGRSAGTNDNTSATLTARYAGGLWGAVSALSNAGALYSQDARLAMNASGQAMAVWREAHADGLQTWARRRLPDGTWGATPTRIDSPLPASTADGPLAVAVDSAGNAFALWTHSLPGDSANALYAQRYTALGMAWGTPQVIDSADGGVNGLALAADANGRALAVWDQSGLGDPRLDLWFNGFR